MPTAFDPNLSPTFWMVFGSVYLLVMGILMWALRPTTVWGWAHRLRARWSRPRPVLSILQAWGMALWPVVGLILAPAELMPHLMAIEMLVSAPCLLRWAIAVDRTVVTTAVSH